MRAVIQRWIICLCGGMLFPFADAQVVQRGEVLEMNSGNRPLAGVEIRATGAAPSDSDQEGQVVLSFVSSLPGDPLLLDGVYKKGFEMVNREKVDNWNLSSDAVLKIVLGRTEMIDAMRKIFFFLKGREKDMEEAKLAPKYFKEEFIQQDIQEK